MTTPTNPGICGDPAVYDILQTPGTAAEVDVLEKIEAGLGVGPLRRDRLWFEPACGTGRYLRIAARRGRRIAGYDQDPQMVAYAAGRLGKAVRVGDLTEPLVPGVRPGSVDFAFNPVNTIRLLPDDAAVKDHLAQIAWLLAPGGMYAVGLSLTDYARAEPEEDLWEAVRGRCRVSQLVNYLPPEPGTSLRRTEVVISHLTITRPWGVEHRDDRFELRCYNTAQWRRLVAKSALRIIGSYDATGSPRKRRRVPYQIDVLVPAAAAAARLTTRRG